MEIPIKTLKSGFSLPVYGLGTWQMGGGWEADTSQDEREIHAIRYALDQGITHLDTAESYGNGHSEELIAYAMQGFDRSKLVITSKVSGNHQGYNDILRSCEASLERLRTDYIDLYLLHRFPDVGTDIRDTMRAMDRLVTEGMVRSIGACNLTVDRFKAAQAVTENKLVCNQLHYSLDCREIIDKNVLEYCQQKDVLVTAWGPLSKGTLEEAALLHEMAKKYQKTPYQVALNWLITQTNVITIPKTSSPKHLDENLGALGWELSQGDWQRLADDFPGQTNRSSRVPLDYEADVKP
ncbi:aldo/keto reductase [Candidatus Saccharibacteria bacterium]|nr:MAG: aldo/keto reductase [Candidatus Saccharibacteria bacterium]